MIKGKIDLKNLLAFTKEKEPENPLQKNETYDFEHSSASSHTPTHCPKTKQKTLVTTIAEEDALEEATIERKEVLPTLPGINMGAV